jgi:hypothetical protein
VAKELLYLKKCADPATIWSAFFIKNINESDVMACTNTDSFIKNPKAIEEKRNMYCIFTKN